MYFAQPNHPEVETTYTITEYGIVGKSIKGTFQGTILETPNYTIHSITNGKFEFIRKNDFDDSWLLKFFNNRHP